MNKNKLLEQNCIELKTLRAKVKDYEMLLLDMDDVGHNKFKLMTNGDIVGFAYLATGFARELLNKHSVSKPSEQDECGICENLSGQNKRLIEKLRVSIDTIKQIKNFNLSNLKRAIIEQKLKEIEDI